jgi:hypothetical protein
MFGEPNLPNHRPAEQNQAVKRDTRQKIIGVIILHFSYLSGVRPEQHCKISKSLVIFTKNLSNLSKFQCPSIHWIISSTSAPKTAPLELSAGRERKGRDLAMPHSLLFNFGRDLLEIETVNTCFRKGKHPLKYHRVSIFGVKIKFRQGDFGIEALLRADFLT